jgi:putative membrane protein
MMGWMSLWMVLGLVVLAAVIAAGVYYGRRFLGPEQSRHETPSEVLDRRLAAGEISPEEYSERKAMVGNGEPPAA